MMTINLAIFRNAVVNNDFHDDQSIVANAADKFGSKLDLNSGTTPLRTAFIASLNESGMMATLSKDEQASIKNQHTALTFGEVRSAFKNATVDIRGNDKQAVANESNIAKECLTNMCEDTYKDIKGHVEAQLQRIGKMESKLEEYSALKASNGLGGSAFTDAQIPVFDKMEAFYIQRKLPLLSEISPQIEKDLESGGAKLAEVFGNPDYDMKSRLDAYTLMFLKNTDSNSKERYDECRSSSVFKERGRELRSVSTGSSASAKDMHSGLSAAEDREVSQENTFDIEIRHAKGFFDAVYSNTTVQDFRRANAPFVGGASGSILSEIMDIEYAAGGTSPASTGKNELSADELSNREILIGVKAMQLISLGHHSLSECLLAAQSLGYFKDVPDPLTDYSGAVDKLADKMSGILNDESKDEVAIGVGANDELAPVDAPAAPNVGAVMGSDVPAAAPTATQLDQVDPQVNDSNIAKDVNKDVEQVK